MKKSKTITKTTKRPLKKQKPKAKKVPSKLVRGLRYVPFAVLIVLNLAILMSPVRSKAQPAIASTPTQPATEHQADVLAYASSMSVGDLLAGTNQQRAANGVGALSLNGQLNAAAQAKANDMVARDYWSHTTPDGQQPWIFFQNTGYVYKRAGENLAYGFGTAGDTITGWMNSPPHRENLLDSQFRDVGFGFANSPNFVGSGQETVVVAEYGTPAGASSAAPSSAAGTSTTHRSTAAPRSSSAPASSAPTPTPEATPTPIDTSPSAPPHTPPATTKEEQTVSDTPDDTPQVKSKNISRLQVATAGIAPWSTAVTMAAGVSIISLWLVSHLRYVKRTIVSGERYVMHHLHIDLTVLAFGILLVLLCQNVGVVR